MTHMINDDLLANTNYTVSLMAWNAGGRSDPSYDSVVTPWLVPGEQSLLLLLFLLL